MRGTTRAAAPEQCLPRGSAGTRMAGGDVPDCGFAVVCAGIVVIELEPSRLGNPAPHPLGSLLSSEPAQRAFAPRCVVLRWVSFRGRA